MKKWMGILAAGVMSLALGITAIAAPSPSANGIVQRMRRAVDANGNTVTAEFVALDADAEAAIAGLKDMETVKEILGAEYVEGMEIVDARQVVVPEGTVFPITLTFEVPGVLPTTNVAILCFDGTSWIKIPVKAGDGFIEATFDSLFPMVFIVDRNTMSSSNASTATGSTTSPKTGESTVVMGFALAALLAAGGAWALSTKKRA